jgi:hypothetical protein
MYESPLFQFLKLVSGGEGGHMLTKENYRSVLVM